MARIIVIGVIVTIAVFVITNLGLFNRGDADNPGQRLVEATTQTNNQAGRLAEVFNSVNPHSEVPADTPTDGSGTTDDDDVEDRGTTAASSPTDTAVRDAYSWMVYYANQSGVDSQQEYIKAAGLLREEWEPRYRSAREEYNKLQHQVDFTRKSADEYFSVQSDLTARIKDSELKLQMEKIDREERGVYRTWEERADSTVRVAANLMQDLEDMDVVIAKTNLSAHFAALTSSTQTLPANMKALHEELEYFRQATQDIHATFGIGPASQATQ